MTNRLKKLKPDILPVDLSSFIMINYEDISRRLNIGVANHEVGLQEVCKRICEGRYQMNVWKFLCAPRTRKLDYCTGFF